VSRRSKGKRRRAKARSQDFGVTHTFETYEGDHTNRVVERIEMKVLPFFSNSLSFNAPKK